MTKSTFYTGHVDRYLAQRLTDIIDLLMVNTNNMYRIDVLTGGEWYDACFFEIYNDKELSRPVNVKLFKRYDTRFMFYVMTITKDCLFSKTFFRDLLDSVATCSLDRGGMPYISIFSNRLKDYIEQKFTINRWSSYDLLQAPIMLGEYDNILCQIACHELRHLKQIYVDTVYKTIDTEFINNKAITFPDKYLEWVINEWNERHQKLIYRHCMLNENSLIQKIAKEEDAFVTELIVEIFYGQHVLNKEFKIYWQKVASMLYI